MRHVDLNKLGLPEHIRQVVERANNELLVLTTDEERKAYIKKKEHVWRRVRPYLAKILGRTENDAKCWYCEGKSVVFTPHVDHFRPKGRVLNKGYEAEGGYWWLAFNVTNYRLTCQFCNSGDGKNDQFPLDAGCKRALGLDDKLNDEVILLLDPIRFADRNWLTFSDDGQVFPLKPVDTFWGKKAKTSIDVYDLNHGSKVDARKQVRLDCMELVKRAKRALEIIDNQNYRQNQAALLLATEMFESVFHDIEARIAEDAEFSSAARIYLRGTGEQWLANI